jgi:deazaflavin-dependent oxidoreductase (nitroreductase family)
MARRYRVTPAVRVVNRFVGWLTRRGRGPAELITTTGRRTGQTRTTPLSPITVDAVEYLVSPYGDRDWVRNARTHPVVTLRRGSRTRSVRLTEVTGPAMAPVVAAYHHREAFARRFMEVPEHPTLSDFKAAADRFPVFRVD